MEPRWHDGGQEGKRGVESIETGKESERNLEEKECGLCNSPHLQSDNENDKRPLIGKYCFRHSRIYTLHTFSSLVDLNCFALFTNRLTKPTYISRRVICLAG